MTTQLHINNVNFTLPNGKAILRDINLQVNTGEFLVLVGSNGSGKSTLIKLLNRQYRLRDGEINLNNRNLNDFSHRDFSRNVITLTQFVKDSLFLDLTILENAALLTNMRDRTQLANYLAKFNPALANALNNLVSDLSGGEQQQLAFALYMTKQPLLLLLDEHTSALDPKVAERIMQMTHDYVRQHNITCIMTTHNRTFAEQYGDRLIAMKNGHLLQQAAGNDGFLDDCYD